MEIPFGFDDWIGFDVSGIDWNCSAVSGFAPLKRQKKEIGIYEKVVS